MIMYKQTSMQSNYRGRPLNKNNSESMLRVCLLLFSAMETEPYVCGESVLSLTFPSLPSSGHIWVFSQGPSLCSCHRPFNTHTNLTEILPAKLVNPPLKSQLCLCTSLSQISLLTYRCLFIFLSLQSSSTNTPSFFMDVKYWFWVNRLVLQTQPPSGVGCSWTTSQSELENNRA